MKHVGTLLPHKHAHKAVNCWGLTQALYDKEHCTMVQQNKDYSPSHNTVLVIKSRSVRCNTDSPVAVKTLQPHRHMLAITAWCGTVSSTVDLRNNPVDAHNVSKPRYAAQGATAKVPWSRVSVKVHHALHSQAQGQLFTATSRKALEVTGAVDHQPSHEAFWVPTVAAAPHTEPHLRQMYSATDDQTVTRSRPVCGQPEAQTPKQGVTHLPRASEPLAGCFGLLGHKPANKLTPQTLSASSSCVLSDLRQVVLLPQALHTQLRTQLPLLQRSHTPQRQQHPHQLTH